MIVQILVDNVESYIIPYAKELIEYFLALGHNAKLIHRIEQVEKGDVLFLLSCQNIFKSQELNHFNVVIHASNLPNGRGWSPLTWQILENKNDIVVTLFEAIDKVDAGKIYLQENLTFQGHELLPELQEQLSKVIVHLAKEFVNRCQSINAKEQTGKATYYLRRKIQDSELDIAKSINEQFNLLRVCDNEKYPAFFYRNGIKYILKIEKA